MASIERLYVLFFIDSDGDEHQHTLTESEATQLAEYLANALPQEQKPKR